VQDAHDVLDGQTTPPDAVNLPLSVPNTTCSSMTTS
jgi:hypothetical protein